jgi:predicted transcriptional regulator YdeE
LVVPKGALILPSSTEFCWQDAWMNEDIENCYRFYIITSSLKTKLTRKSQVIIIQIWEPKRIGKTFEEELKKLANVLVNGHG